MEERVSSKFESSPASPSKNFFENKIDQNFE